MMQRIKPLLARYSQTVFLFFLGLILIVYVGLGVLYFQQDPLQNKYQTQITGLTAILRNPLPDKKILEANLSDIDVALSSMGDNVTIAMLVSLAAKNGIDISEDSGRFVVPIPSHHNGPGSYKIVSFSGIHVQGDYNNVMAFIGTLDSDEKLDTLISSSPRTVVRLVTGLILGDVQVLTTGEEATRREEFRNVIAAVKVMMEDNSLFRIPNPELASEGRATNLMGDDPFTPVFDGFPDIITTADGKQYTGNDSIKTGYLLYEHDKVNSDNHSLTTSRTYYPSLKTSYYYTAEADGTVRQWSGPNTHIDKEYLDSGSVKTELTATISVDIYFKPK
jgi:hypothetical protein